MTVRLAVLALLEAKEGKGAELGAFLESGRTLAAAESGTVTWYAFKISESEYGIFDTFETEDVRRRESAVVGPRRHRLSQFLDESLYQRVEQVRFDCRDERVEKPSRRLSNPSFANFGCVRRSLLGSVVTASPADVTERAT